VAEEARNAQEAAESKYNEDVAESKKPSKYVMPPQTSLVSEYEQAEAKAHRAARHHHHHRHGHHNSSMLSPNKGGGAASPSPMNGGGYNMLSESKLTDDDWLPEESKHDLIERAKVTYDKHQGKRHHCWVLVRGGKRSMEGFKFIEPSTGMIYDTSEPSPYGEITAIFNDQNYFVKLPKSANRGVKSSSSDQQQQQSFDTLNHTIWECVFVDPAKLLEEKELLKEHLADMGLSEPNSPNTASIGSGEMSPKSAIPQPITPLPVINANAPATNVPLATGMGSGAGAGPNGSPQQQQYHHHHHHHHHSDFIAHDDRDNILDLPPPWVGKLAINRAALSMKYPPTGSRTVIYFKCKVN
jgi:hypothetical protein